MPPPQNRSNRNHALAIISLSAISDRFTVSPHFRVAEPFCRILLFHTVRPLLSSSPSGRKAWRRGGAETNRRAESKLSLHGNPGPCFLGRLHPGLRFPGSIVFAKYDRGRNENYTPFFPPPPPPLPPPPSPIHSPREMLYFLRVGRFVFPFRAVLHLSAFPASPFRDDEVVRLYTPWSWENVPGPAMRRRDREWRNENKAK